MSAAREDLVIPAPRLAAVTGGLNHCVRHGEPAVKRVRFALQSRPQVTGNRANLGNVLATAGRVAEHAGAARVTRLTDWPLCRRCARTRGWGLGVASVMFFGGVLAVLAAFGIRATMDGPSLALAPLLLGGFVAVVAAPWPFVLGSIPRIIQARTSTDGGSVLITAAHPAFAAEIRALLG
ncbi:hypothetical protein [Krasilnikovia sp. M28-CT-15]|uniref:hypothetical protein n=1 Tax=Krasilnikovia sp. M28-CT-15 TaxID=3373540 RepID=UPI0038767F2C